MKDNQHTKETPVVGDSVTESHLASVYDETSTNPGFFNGSVVSTIVRITIYSLACLTTSCVYFGWQAYSEMLMRGGGYGWLCNEGEDFQSSGEACDEQAHKVASTYSVANGSEFVCIAVGGLLFDLIGPRYTAIIGECLFATATLLLAFSTQSFQAYIPALLLSGICVNVTTFPALTIVESIPSRQALAIAVIIGCQTAASIVAPILNSMWIKNPHWTYRDIWLTYLGVVWAPVTALYIWALPRRRNYTLTNKVDSEKVDDSNSLLCQSVSGTSLKAAPEHFEANSKEAWKMFGGNLLTIEMACMAVYCLSLMMQFAYYPAVVLTVAGKQISNFVSWTTPVQGPMSVVIGFFMDYTGTIPIMYLMIATLLWVSVTCGFWPDTTGLMFTTAALFVAMQSVTYNLKYTFVNETFDPYNFGKLVGILGIMGGAGVYMSGPMALSKNSKAVFLSLTIVSAVMLIVTIVIHIRQSKGINYRTLEMVNQTHRRKRGTKPTGEATTEV